MTEVIPGQMIDAVDPANIGSEYDGSPAVRITVLADPAGQVFDYESGNARAPSVAMAVARRYRDGKWSIVYANQSQFGEVHDAVVAAGTPFLDPSAWPEAGAYAFIADPSGNVAAGRWTPPVAPIAVQVEFAGTYDLSRTFGPFPARVAGYVDGPLSQWPDSAWARFVPVPDTAAVGPVSSPLPPSPSPPSVVAVPSQPAPPPVVPVPPPQPPASPPEQCQVNLPILQQGAQGPPVKAVQALVGGLVQDSIFGPRTDQAVRAFQSQHGLGVDGIVGPNTWAALLGV